MALRRSVRWRSLQHGGIEHLAIGEWPDAIVARSTVIGEASGRGFGLLYQVNLSPSWTGPLIQVQRTDGVILTLSTNGQGTWRDTHDARPDLSGCIDIDFEVTPFTNTLPIRRAPLAIGESRRIMVAYIPADTLEPRPDEQIYTRLDAHRYRFEEADGSFEAEITVDDDGLVVDYPGLFERMEAT